MVTSGPAQWLSNRPAAPAEPRSEDPAGCCAPQTGQCFPGGCEETMWWGSTLTQPCHPGCSCDMGRAAGADVKCTLWFLYYKPHVLLTYFHLGHMVSSCLLPFVMPDKLGLYYILICCWEAWNLCAFSTSSIRYQSLLALRPRHTLNRFWMDLVRAEGPDPSFAVRGFSSRFKSSPVSCNIVVLSARNPARSLIGWEAGGSGISESLQRICGCCSGFSRCQ